MIVSLENRLTKARTALPTVEEASIATRSLLHSFQSYEEGESSKGINCMPFIALAMADGKIPSG